MERSAPPRGLTARSLVAVSVFAAAVVPGWALGDLAERVTGNGLLDWLITCASGAAAIAVLGPQASYRRRDAWLGAVPLLGWYLIALMSWRGARVPDRARETRG